jgi:hypothetical protein
VSDTSQGPGWWIASDGKWYPPPGEPPAPDGAATPTDPIAAPDPSAAPTDPSAAAAPPAPGWWLASDGNWYPPAGDAAASAPTAPPAAPSGTSVPASSTEPATPPEPAAASSAPKRPVKILPILVGVLVVFVLIVGVVGFVKLRGRGTELTPNTVASGPDELPSSDLTLAPDTVVVRGGGGAAVKELTSDGLVLDAGAEGAGDLEEGDVMILTGITVGKVTSVDRSGGDVRVGLEPASITDVITDGQISWPDQQVDFSKASLRVWEPGSEPVNKRAGAASSDPLGDGPVRPAVVGSPAAGALAMIDADPLELAQGEARSGEIGGYRYEFTPRVTADRLAFDLTVGKDDDGYVIAIVANVDVSGLSTNGSLAVSGGSVTDFGFNASSMHGSATVDATASTGPQFGQGGETSFEIPMSIDIPLIVGGLPFTLSIGASMTIEPAFSAADASVTGKLELTYDGNTGMSVSGGSLSGTGALNPETTSPEDVIGGLSLSPVAVIVHMEFPQISFGLGTALARASATFNMRSSVGVQFSGSSHVIPCAAQNQALVATAGITGEFLGAEVELASIELFRQNWDFFVPDAQACQF